MERALAEGHPPPGEFVYGRNRDKGAIRVVAEKHGIFHQTLLDLVGTPKIKGRIYRHYKLKIDWKKYTPKTTVTESRTARAERQVKELKAEIAANAIPADPVEVRRMRDELASLKQRLKDMERRALAAEDIRSQIGLGPLPPPPETFPARDMSRPSLAETIVLFLSDLQWGELVDIGAMDGLNSYSLEIARARLYRWARAVIELSTKHWAGIPPDRIILILGGDLVSGALHYELAKTDELPPLAAVRDVAEHLRNVILQISKAIGCPIDIISLAGNHGRTTIKPESKQVTITSLDILVSDFLEMGLKDIPGVNFFTPVSPDAVFSVYGWIILATHGDRIGSRGGAGFIGPAATIARGFKRLIADYAARGIHIDTILIGHFHCPLELEEGFCNGSLPGPTEYSRDFRFRPHPATQLYFTVHPHRRCALRRWIDVGVPEEGSLYEPPPPDRPLRPRFRLKTVTGDFDAQIQDAASRSAGFQSAEEDEA
jgi:hypothetical protein